MELEAQITDIQKFYPLIYLACHKEHSRAASSSIQLSARDSSILAHLAVGGLCSPTALSRHLNISASTLSEATARLAELGYLRSVRNQEDERKQDLILTQQGLNAMKKASVLDSEKLGAVLKILEPSDRLRAVEGLALLAKAALMPNQ